MKPGSVREAEAEAAVLDRPGRLLGIKALLGAWDRLCGLFRRKGR